MDEERQLFDGGVSLPAPWLPLSTIVLARIERGGENDTQCEVVVVKAASQKGEVSLLLLLSPPPLAGASGTKIDGNNVVRYELI